MSAVGKLETVKSTFQWTIENYDSIVTTIGGAVISPVFKTGNLQWRLEFYPHGRSEEYKEWTGLFLHLLSDAEVSVSYIISLLDDKNDNVVYKTSGRKDTFNKNVSWGYHKFCMKSIIRDETKGALVNGTLRISCAISILDMDPNDENRLEDDKAKVYFEKLLENGELSDVTFEIGKEQLKLHKAIVSSLSPVFLAMFQHQMKENEDNVVKITDVKYEVMRELFRYIYVRKVNNIQNIAADLFAAADKYDVQGLKLKCEQILSENLSIENALERLEFAVKYNSSILKPKVIEFVASRLEDFVDRTEFVEMDSSCKDELLRTIAKDKVKKKEEALKSFKKMSLNNDRSNSCSHINALNYNPF